MHINPMIHNYKLLLLQIPHMVVHIHTLQSPSTMNPSLAIYLGLGQSRAQKSMARYTMQTYCIHVRTYLIIHAHVLICTYILQ